MERRHAASWQLAALAVLLVAGAAQAVPSTEVSIETGEDGPRVGTTVRFCTSNHPVGDYTVTGPDGGQQSYTPSDFHCINILPLLEGQYLVNGTTSAGPFVAGFAAFDDAQSFGATYVPVTFWALLIGWFLTRETMMWAPAFAATLGVLGEFVELPMGRVGAALLTLLLFWVHLLAHIRLRKNNPGSEP